MLFKMLSLPVSRQAARPSKASRRLLTEDEHTDRHFSAIFVPRSLAAVNFACPSASTRLPRRPSRTRSYRLRELVQLPKGGEARLSAALGLPRVSFIGMLDGAPHTKSLVDLVRECVPEIEVLWLEEAKKFCISSSEGECHRELCTCSKEGPEIAEVSLITSPGSCSTK
jgi:hypothetical protein